MHGTMPVIADVLTAAFYGAIVGGGVGLVVGLIAALLRTKKKQRPPI